MRLWAWICIPPTHPPLASPSHPRQESDVKRKLRPDQISSMVVASFQEKTLRVYSRNPDPAYVRAAHEAFESWVQRQFGGALVTGTPSKAVHSAYMDGQDGAARGGGGGRGGASGGGSYFRTQGSEESCRG
jgi:hypothetical protein